MPTRNADRTDAEYRFRNMVPGRAAASLGVGKLTDDEVEACDQEEREAAKVGLRRPLTTADCPPPTVGCPWAACKYSLLAWRESRYKTWKQAHPSREITDFDPVETCALRVAARADRLVGDDNELGRTAAMSFEELGRLHNVTIEAASRIVAGALAKLAANPEAVAILGEFAAEKGRSVGGKP